MLDNIAHDCVLQRAMQEIDVLRFNSSDRNFFRRHYGKARYIREFSVDVRNSV